MKFTIALQHSRTTKLFLISVEKDGIYLAFPRKDSGRSETIFLTRSGETWVGDSEDKKLVQKIGKEIDVACRQKAKRKRRPA